MGGLISTPDTRAQERSDEIDRQIEEDNRRFKRELQCAALSRLLDVEQGGWCLWHSSIGDTPWGLFGIAGSGKTTLIQQFRVYYEERFALDELAMYVPIIRRNVFDSVYQLVSYMKDTGLKSFEGENRLFGEQIYPHTLPDFGSDAILSPEIAQAIHRFWTTPSSPSFLNEVLRIGTPWYLPNETDILHARATDTGIKETRFNMGQLSIKIIDVSGQRSERKKWIHCFESVTSIIFCTALSDYDQVLLEDRSQNRMNESLLLFESVINSRWFLRTSVILFMTKTDVFKEKLNEIPLERYFPEYTGGNDINKAAKYILWKFMQANRARLSVYPHLTQATDTSNMLLVFAAVKETILQNALKDDGIL
ncbi:hypothetical protein D9619_002294 [Psilocybe cf. subviscida]|uniref:Uncharacterized protein n=1 Tax=Psilocybe cf. subviscida TaxID=2480587 RepID=A0A8H5BGX4_9AGAR|nr:hypothetical protein D9619_002294 [Psilocybe cf. subviscida]